MIDWYKKVLFENYANFNGRAGKNEFWYYTLCNIIICIIFYILIFILALNPENGAFATAITAVYFGYGLYSLATFIPSLAVVVRRLHDINKSGWYYFIVLVPVIGIFILIYWLTQNGNKDDNEYGGPPKNKVDPIDIMGLNED